MKEFQTLGFGENKLVQDGLLDHIYESYVSQDSIVDTSTDLKTAGDVAAAAKKAIGQLCTEFNAYKAKHPWNGAQQGSAASTTPGEGQQDATFSPLKVQMSAAKLTTLEGRIPLTDFVGRGHSGHRPPLGPAPGGGVIGDRCAPGGGPPSRGERHGDAGIVPPGSVASPGPSTGLQLLACDAGLGPRSAGVAFDDGSSVDILLPRLLFSVSNAALATGLGCPAFYGYGPESLTVGGAWLEGSRLGATPVTAPVPEDPLPADRRESFFIDLTSPSPDGCCKPGEAQDRLAFCASGCPAQVS